MDPSFWLGHCFVVFVAMFAMFHIHQSLSLKWGFKVLGVADNAVSGVLVLVYNFHLNMICEEE